MKLRKEFGFDEYFIADDSDYTIYDETGDECIVDRGGADGRAQKVLRKYL